MNRTVSATVPATAGEFQVFAIEVRRAIQSLEILPDFPDLQRFLGHHLFDLRDWQLALPVISCLSAGGSLEDGSKLAAAWYLMYLASELFDEIEDQEFIPGPLVPTPQVATNLATGLVFLSFHTLSKLNNPDAVVRTTQIFSSLGFDAARGQHRDLLYSDLPGEAALRNYWETIILKAGSVIRMGTAGGAACGTSDVDMIERLGDYGTAIGVMIQLLDDCRDAFSTSEDAIARWEISLPLLLYLLSTGEDRIVYPEVQTTAEWRRLLEESGILSAISMILLDWKARALESVRGLKSSEVDVLEKIPALFLEPFSVPEG
jgi:geranylgeranyl pyrophosphate synthase